MASADILRAARARIEDPKNWTRNALARGPLGEVVPVNHPTACKWCAYGSLYTMQNGPDWRLAKDALELAGRALFKLWPEDINDGLGHEAVLKMYGAAIAAAEAEAGR